MTIEVDEYGLASTAAFCPLFDLEVTVQLFTDLEDDRVTDAMKARVHDLQALGPQHRDQVATMLHEHAEICFETTSYGHVHATRLEDETATNRAAFGIRTPDDAFRAARLTTVQIDAEHDSFAYRYLLLVFDVPWEGEHGCGIALRDGTPFTWGSADLYVGGDEPV
ncbi:DUF6985 domain-containing protein [Rubrivirga sp.]|uniref:DUF6985 domain-containing protein n=1 Tax=Rubrivirga sp. TaxID=1885344 RepID=UPI003C72B233